MPDKKKILIVDDEPDIRELISTILGAEDEYELIEAVDGEDGLSKAAKNKPDLIILDLMMPRMDGLEVCRRLRGTPGISEIPVVILTVKTTYEARERGFSVGADMYLTKPFDPEELKSIVKSVFSGKIPLKHTKAA